MFLYMLFLSSCVLLYPMQPDLPEQKVAQEIIFLDTDDNDVYGIDTAVIEWLQNSESNCPVCNNKKTLKLKSRPRHWARKHSGASSPDEKKIMRTFYGQLQTSVRSLRKRSRFKKLGQTSSVPFKRISSKI